MKLACSSPMVPGRTLTEQADTLREWGYDAISVFVPYSSWTDATRTELLSLDAQTGVRPCEFVLMDSLYGHLMSDDLRLRARSRAMYVEAATVCAELGAVTELEYEYGPQDPMPLFDPYQRMDGEQTADFIEMYLQILQAVDGTDGLVLIEPLNRYESRYLNTVADSAEIVRTVDHPNAGLLLDFFHMSIEEADLALAVAAAGSHTRHVHLADNNRLLPGYGRTDWEAMFDALRSIGFDGVVSLECSTSGDPAITLPQAAKRLRELMG